MEFPGFLGNDGVKRALNTAFSSRRFPHALILQGEKGCGKRTLAKLLAKALVCRNREQAPCGVCPSCVRAAAGSHPDIRVEEGSGATRSLTVDTVKSIISDCYRKPEEAEVSVYLLFVGSRMLEPAQNKLLKVIEEPPANTVFVLVCETAEQLLPTIRSRAQSFKLRPPPIEEAAALVSQRTGMEPQEARELAVLCGGNIGHMLEEAEGGDAAAALRIACDIAQGMTASGGHAILKAAAAMQKDRHLCREVLSRLSMIFRDALLCRTVGAISAEQLLSGAPEAVKRLTGLPVKKLYTLPGIAEACGRKVERNANMALLLTVFCAQLLEAAGR